MKPLILNLIKLYQKTLSPNHGLGLFGFYTGCRFYPTCSDYTLFSLKKYGIVRGLLKSMKRIFKCGPWSGGGVDFP